MKVTPWFRYHRVGNALRKEAIIEAINRCGVALEPAHRSPPMGSGLLLFDGMDAQLCEAVDRDTRHGFDRVLAVATRSDALIDGAVWRLLEAGAADVFSWDEMPDPAATIAARFERYASVDELLKSSEVRDEFAGESLAWVTILRQVVEIAAFSEASVLITGESGTGKELIARLIHALDRRPEKGNFVVLDSTTVLPGAGR